MTDNISTHMRITGVIPAHEDVTSRRAAAGDLATAWAKARDTSQIVARAALIASSLGGDGTPDVTLATEVQEAVQTHAAAFLYTDQPLHVGICAANAALSMLASEPGKQGWTALDIYSNGLWLALSFQPALADPKREEMRIEVLTCAQERSAASAEKARERDDVPDPVDLTVTIGEEDKVTTNFRRAAIATIEGLRRNAALDREEIDFIWFTHTNRSRLLGRPHAAIGEASRLVASGIEAAGHLRRLPADVHRDLALRTVETDPELDLVELLTEIGDDRGALASGVDVARVQANPTVFPLLATIVTGDAQREGAAIKRKASEWGARALLEGALSRMMSTGNLKQ